VALGERVLIDESWPRGKAKALIKLLALQPGRSLHREQVLDTLWPELTPENAAAQLRQNLYYLRSALRERGLEATLVISEGNRVTLASQITVDVDRFRATAEAAGANSDGPSAYIGALSLYTGGLLPDDLYEEWTLRPREELAGLRNRLLLKLARELIAAGRIEEAILQLERLVALDPVSEEAQRELMRAYAVTGSRDKSLRQYQLLRALESDLGVAPSEETETLFREVKAGQIKGDAALLPHKPPVPRPAPRPRRAVPLRLAAAVGAIALIAGGTLGVLVLTGTFDSTSAAQHAYTRGSIHFDMDGTATLVSGDCTSSDLIYSAPIRGTATGTFHGNVSASYTPTFLLESRCKLSRTEGEATVMDEDGDKLTLKQAAIVSLIDAANAPASGALEVPRQPMLITGGSGKYEGLIGRGLCQVPNQAEAISPTEVRVTAVGDCTLEFERVAANRSELLIVEGGSSSLRLPVYDPNAPPALDLSIVVSYFNAGDETLQDLELRLPDPFGGAVSVSAGGEPFAPSSQRAWALPDLPAGEVAQFYIDVRLLSANGGTIDLEPEIRGTGLKKPARTSPVRLDVLY
jgi:DNA-binding SARP family transcriptional activator